MRSTIFIVMYFIFAIVFVGCITAAAVFFNKSGLLWWFILPTITTFFALISCAGKE